MPKKPIILDFDSTLCAVESLDALASMVLADDPAAQVKVAEIERLTNLGMSGELPLSESLARRLATLTFDRAHVGRLVESLGHQLTPGLVEDCQWIEDQAEHLHVVSGGFVDWIAPVLTPLGFRAEHIHANVLCWDGDVCVCFNKDQPRSRNGGKPEIVQQLGLGPNKGAIAVGDGISDLELKRSGHADRFIAFTAHAQREVVVQEADLEAADWTALREILDH
ncbi:MAG: haloacid dehalogenase-like hydrolase, partial [Planctomycetota bacterium]|nr:haloacid dehalogenase-like hydrolase [Planctomycetota bacterium]